MITESFQKYRGFTIRLRAVTGNGFWFDIIRQVPNAASPDGMRNVYLRKKGFNFIQPGELLRKAKSYIDNFAPELEKKFELMVKDPSRATYKLMNPCKTHNSKSNRTVRIRAYSVDQIFDFIGQNKSEAYYVDDDGNRCKLKRARIFHEIGLCCAEPGCALTGTFFALERWPDGDMHFDLFAVDGFGDDVLMTVDHLYPKSRGGKSSVSNYRPMCRVHNELKADTVMHVEKLELPQITEKQ